MDALTLQASEGHLLTRTDTNGLPTLWEAIDAERIRAFVIGYHGPHPEALVRGPLPSWWCQSEFSFDGSGECGIEVGYRLVDPIHLGAGSRTEPQKFAHVVSELLLEVWGPEAQLLTHCRNPLASMVNGRPVNNPWDTAWTLGKLSQHAKTELRKQRGGWTREQQVTGGMSKSQRKVDAALRTLEPINSAKKIQHTERVARVLAYRSDGMSYADIARLENCSESALRTTVAKYKKKMSLQGS